MSMLTHRFEQPYDPPERNNAPEAWISKVDAAAVRRACQGALALLSMGSVLSALIALKTLIHMSRPYF
ncbi:hypothetical protein QA640_11145 [Bradyrhizobium sp. CB82]|nr:hypothetical protein [Bradyrhizobium sp. CB82]WFU42951.1 hypothetical protein QA640_11145 [Bradyrhizobium sp. CB82]